MNLKIESTFLSWAIPAVLQKLNTRVIVLKLSAKCRYFTQHFLTQLAQRHILQKFNAQYKLSGAYFLFVRRPARYLLILSTRPSQYNHILSQHLLMLVVKKKHLVIYIIDLSKFVAWWVMLSSLGVWRKVASKRKWNSSSPSTIFTAESCMPINF